MRWPTTGTVVVTSVLAIGCGNDEGPAARSSSGLYTGTTSQGLSVSVDASERYIGNVAISWVGRCRGRSSGKSGAVGRLHTEQFPGGPLPVEVDDQRREDGTDGDRSTYVRHLEVKADDGGYTGRLRVRTRGYNGQGRGVDVLCDSGDITFSAKPIPAPQVPEVRPTAAQFRDADFHEQIYDTIASLGYDGGTANFCAAVTKRLARSVCKGGRTRTFERLSLIQQGIDDLREKDDPVRRVTGGAAVTVYAGESRYRSDGAPEEHAVRTLRFKPVGRGEWRLDVIGPKRWSRKMP
ncbi:MAG: hypothetical protein Q8K79_15400 [Solirubrobacteraceae bacterium]|nr:hypothetical protein [Solirubrobacteraceae bacterium]